MKPLLKAHNHFPDDSRCNEREQRVISVSHSYLDDKKDLRFHFQHHFF